VEGDGSFTNKTVMLNLPPNTQYVGRTRPDTTLQAPGNTTKGGRIKYGATLDKPKGMATEEMLKVNLGKFHYAGAYREMKYLALGPVFRKTSTRDKLLRLMILEPVPYGKGESRGYNERAYLLTTDMSLPAEDLVAYYLMRWELENIHRIFKTTLGIGDAQVRKQRLPPAMAAYFTMLVVAIHLTQGDERHEGFGKLPKWTTNRRE
jgi:hypothetical protein